MKFLTFPSWIHPEIIPGFPLGTWYGFMYIVGFGISYFLVARQLKKIAADKNCAIYKSLGAKADETLSKTNLGNFATWVILGLLIGARVFSTLVYAENRLYYWTHPWMIFWPFSDGVFTGLRGMSYHGGAIGATLAAFLYCLKHKQKFFFWADTVLACAPLGYTFGRLGNFINQELYGRVTSSPIGMLFDSNRVEVFPAARFPEAAKMAEELGLSPYGFINLPRHPSQLYEAFFEGIVLWLILWFIVRRIKRHDGQVAGAYFFGYGFFRFFIEYFREPDSNLGYVINFTKYEFTRWDLAWRHPAGAISLGQILCFLMMVAGAALIIAPIIIAKVKAKQKSTPAQSQTK